MISVFNLIQVLTNMDKSSSFCFLHKASTPFWLYAIKSLYNITEQLFLNYRDEDEVTNGIGMLDIKNREQKDIILNEDVEDADEIEEDDFSMMKHKKGNMMQLLDW